MRSTLGIVALAALGAVSFASLHSTNFRGYDEWLIFWMLARGLVSFPYANRPLGLVWHAPAWLIAPERLWGFVLVHAAWLTLTGVLVFLIVRRLLPQRRELAFLAGAFAIAWMPSDEMRVAPVHMVQYSGAAAGVALATWLLLEAAHRRSRAFLLAALAVAAAAALSIEATVPSLGLAPVLVVLAGRREERRLRLTWAGLFLLLVAGLAVRAALPALTARDALAYQLGGEDALRSPLGVLRQTGLQLRYQLGPLLGLRPAELAAPAAWLAAVVFALGFAASCRARREAPSGGRSVFVLAGAFGVVHAVLAYLPFLLARGVRGPVRTEFLAAAGSAVLIAAAIALAASFLPASLRPWLALVLGAWVVATGTGRTLAMDRGWDRRLYAHQRATLEQVVHAAPGLQPHTLVVLVQSGHTWGFSFSFSKAIEWLYDDRARGWVVEADPFLASTRRVGDELRSEPALATRLPWRQGVERYRADEVIAFAEDETGRLTLLDEWPERAGPPPPGRYAPRERLREGQAAAVRVARLPLR